MKQKWLAIILSCALLLSCIGVALPLTGAAGNQQTYSYKVIQNYETADDRANSGRALVLDGTSSFGTVTKSATSAPETAPAALNGTASFFSQLGSNWGVDHLVNKLSEAPSSDISGVFLRMSYDLTEKMNGKMMVMSVNTTGAETTESQTKDGVTKDVPITGMNKANYDLTNGNTAIRYYNVDGTVNTEASGNLMPAKFDGYIFIPVSDVSKYDWDGISFLYAPNWAATGGPGHWQVTDPVEIVGFDDIGFYAVTNATEDAEYVSIMTAIKAGEIAGGGNVTGGGGSNNDDNDDNDDPIGGGPGNDPNPGEDLGGTYKYQMINTFETATEQDVGLHYCGESFITESNALSGMNSMATTISANDWGMYTLVEKAPEPSFDNVTGFYFRLKVDHSNNPAGNGDRQIFSSTGTAVLGDKEWSGPYAVAWGPEHGEIVCVWLDGTVERGIYIPDNFDGYVFLLGNNTLDTMWANGYLKSLRVGFPAWAAWQNNPLKWKGSDLIFDNVGYYSVSNTDSNSVYGDLAKELMEKFPQAQLPEGFVPQMKTYMTYEDEATASSTGTTTYYFRPYLYYHTETPIAVKWSVVAGKATIEPLDDPNDDSMSIHGAKIIFGSTGAVTIRGALKDDPTQYADYTFTVKKDSSKLDEAIFEATLLVNMLEDGEWKTALEEAIEVSYTVLMDDKVTQGSYEAYVDFLHKLLGAYENGEAVPNMGDVMSPNEPSDTPIENSPQTGEHSLVVWALLCALIGLITLVASVKLKKKAGFEK